MTTQQLIIDRTRLELQDKAQSFEADTVGTGNFKVFDLPVERVRASDITVILNGVVQVNDGTVFTVEEDPGAVHFINVPGNGVSIVIQGFYYESFTDAELLQLVTTAFLEHTYERLDDFGLPLTYATLPPVEEYPLAVLAAIKGLWILATDPERNTDILVPDGVSIPESQRFQHLVGLIQLRQAEYDRLCSLLNIGLGRIQMSDLRRVSRQTNRLVPLYKEREYDEMSAEFKPTQAAIGATVYIYGQNFTGATVVKFGATAAVTFTVVSDNVISAVVPAGAVSGAISVTVPGGTSTTNKTFTVGAPTALFQSGPQRLRPAIDPYIGS